MSAVDHAMAAGDVEGAFQLLRGLAASQGDVESRHVAVDTVRAWLRQYGAQQLGAEPRVLLECCLVLAAVGAPDVELWLRRVEQSGSSRLERPAAAMLTGIWGLHLLHRGDPFAALERVDEARRILGADVAKDFWVSQWPVVACQAHLWLDDPAAAKTAAAEARMPALPSTFVDSVRLPGYLAWAAVVEGELSEAEHQAQLALEGARSLELAATNLGWIFPWLSLAVVARDRDDLDEAERLASLATEAAELASRPPLTLLCLLELARLAMTRGATDDATSIIERSRRVMPAATPVVRDHIDRLEARLAIDLGRPSVPERVAGLRPTAHRALLEARLLLAGEDPSTAVQVLDQAQGMMSTRRLRVEHGLLSARALAPYHRARALDQLEQALQLAEPVGLVRPFVDEGPALRSLLEAISPRTGLDTFASRVVDASHRRPALPRQRIPRKVDGLSDRELDVLRYLASRLTYPEVARELHVSVNTLKSHVKAVYRKLGATGRAEAVQAARDARLI